MRIPHRSILIASLIAAFAAPPALRAQEHEAHHAAAAALPRTPSPKGAAVYFISPSAGAQVTSPVTVRFGLHGMGVAPAGTNAPDTGHHHLIVDVPTPALDTVLPNDAHHVHFGKGQTEVSLELSPGKHTLQLVFADLNHVPHQPPLVSEPITITVK